jgi:hydrogenase maturation factor
MFGLDPFGLIASGSLIIVTRPGAADAVSHAVRRHGMPCAEIGELTDKREGLIIKTERGPEPLRYSATDELTKLTTKQ